MQIASKKRGVRPYKLNVASSEELIEFCSQYNLSEYEIMLVERGNVTHAGAIIARDEGAGIPGKCIVELLEGSREDLSHGHKTPISAVVGIPEENPFRTIRSKNRCTTTP